MLSYFETKENNIQTKDKIKPQLKLYHNTSLP